MSAWKPLKIVSGVAIASIGLVALANGKLAAPEIETIVNAKLVGVRAPVDGLAQVDNLIFGDIVPRGSKIAAVDPVQQFDAAALEVEDARQETLLEQISSLEALAAEKDRQAESYRLARLSQLDARIDEVESSIAMARQKERQATAIRDRKQKLFEAGLVVKSVLIESSAAQEAARIEREMLIRRAGALKSELATARNGVYIGDSYNDTSYSKQRSDEIAVRIADLKAQVVRRKSAARSSAVQVADMSGTTGIGSDARAARSPVDGRIWRVTAAQGDFVRAGEQLAEVADCSSMFVTIDPASADVDTVTIGTKATFRANDGSVFDGRVIFAASSDRSFETIVGAALVQRRTGTSRRSVVVALTADATQRAACPIGLGGRVAFQQTGGAAGLTVESVSGMVHALVARLSSLIWAVTDRAA